VLNLWFANPQGGSRINVSNGVFLCSQSDKAISNLVPFVKAHVSGKINSVDCSLSHITNVIFFYLPCIL
jgi:hypothetical protein